MIKKGFTLLELLVVIGIIGILMTLFTVSYSNAQKQSRDSRRRQDITAIQNAMEQYYADNNYKYPDCGPAATCAPINTYMSGGALPTDPLSSQNYSVTSSSVTNTYTLQATLEKGGTYTLKQLQ